MAPTITARHCEIPESLRARAREVMDRMDALAKRALESTVVFDMDGSESTVELRLHVSAGELFVARGEGPDHRTALDRAEARLKRQISKRYERARRARHSAPQQL